jgi:hypothetical protein
MWNFEVISDPGFSDTFGEKEVYDLMSLSRG